MRFCYVISRHARGNMAAAGVVSGKVSNGPGLARRLLARWPAAAGRPPRRGGKRAASASGPAGRLVTATGLGVVSAVPPGCWASPAVDSSAPRPRRPLRRCPALPRSAARWLFFRSPPRGTAGSVCPPPPVTPVFPTPAFCKSVRCHRGLADRELCSCVLRARGPARPRPCWLMA